MTSLDKKCLGLLSLASCVETELEYCWVVIFTACGLPTGVPFWIPPVDKKISGWQISGKTVLKTHVHVYSSFLPYNASLYTLYCIILELIY